MGLSSDITRDHLFISYAWEDVALAEWLTMKLTSLGYKVWCDRVKLFGGESFPTEIDDAIKNRTHRLLALLSPASLNKPSPKKERTLALSIAQDRRVDFLIPLNLGLKPSELQWTVSDLTYVDFRTNWAAGLDQLVKALQKAHTPCPLDDGRQRVCLSVVPDELTKPVPECVCSNFYAVSEVPHSVIAFRAKVPISRWRFPEIRNKWPAYQVDDHRIMAFGPPSADIASEFAITPAEQHNWQQRVVIGGIRSLDIVSCLLRSGFYVHATQRGLVFKRDILHFPQGLLPNDKMSVELPDGTHTSLSVVGERGFFTPGKPKEHYRHHLAPSFAVCQDFIGDFSLRVSVRLFIDPLDGIPLKGRSIQARHKHVTRDWWNWAWMVRHLAICQHLADSSGKIVLDYGNSGRVVVSAMPFTFDLPVSLNDAEIEKRRASRNTGKKRPEGADDESAAD